MKGKDTKMHVARTLAVALLLFGVGACSADGSGSSSGIEASLNINDEATPQDVGLPTYPGAKLYKDPGDSSSGANIGVSTPMFGLKVAAVKLESADEPEQVARFYRKALSKYGDVLDCTDGAAASGKTTASEALKCESSDSDGHSLVYKVGTEKNQRIVAIKPHGSGSRFDLVHVNVRD
jgi:hypothetical protein